MKETLRLDVTTPCHEDWDAMTANGQGRHCQSCSKTVVDFTTMTDREIISYMSLYATGNTCGRLNDSQLHRLIQTPPERKPAPKYFWSLALTSLLLTYRSVAQQVRTVNSKPVSIARSSDTSKPNEVIYLGKVAAERIADTTWMEMHGRVVNEQGIPVPFASITLTNSLMQVDANETGDYQFRLPATRFAAVEISISSASGYIPLRSAILPDSIQSIEVVKKEHLVKVLLKDFVMKKKSLEEVVVISYPVTRCYSTMGGISVSRMKSNKTPRKIAQAVQQKVQGLLGRSDLKIYPNPAPANGSFTLQLNLKQAGEYNVQFIDVAGRIVGGRQVMITSGGQTETFMGSQLPGHGTYFIRVVGRQDGKIYNTKLVVQ